MNSITNNFLICVIFTASFCACASVGTPFDKSLVSKIKIGDTSKKEIRSLFGKPFRSGVENGREVWIYEITKYSAFSKENVKDLIVVFDEQGRVFSRQVMSSLP